MNLDQNIIKELENIQWFTCCGNPRVIKSTIQLENWSQAEVAFCDPEWESVTADAQARLTEYLSMNYPSKYHGEWNNLVLKAKDTVEELVVPPTKHIIENQGLDSMLLDCVKWDVLHAILERTYAHLSPPCFFEILFTTYKFGKLPCGWKGAWQNGRLLVF